MTGTQGLVLSVTRLDDRAQLPIYAHDGDAGLDLHCLRPYSLQPFERILIETGIALAIPEGYAGFVIPRSGLAIKQGLSLVNTPGLIDSGYRGEIKVAAINLDPRNVLTLDAGDRIAQLVVVPFARVAVVEVEALDETMRSSGGFGSTGR